MRPEHDSHSAYWRATQRAKFAYFSYSDLHSACQSVLLRQGHRLDDAITCEPTDDGATVTVRHRSGTYSLDGVLVLRALELG